MIASRMVLALFVLLLCGSAVALVCWRSQSAGDTPTEMPPAESEEKALQDWHAVPVRLQTFPVTGFTVDPAFRCKMLQEVADWSVAKDMAEAAVAVHALRLHALALNTADCTDKGFYERTLAILTDDREYREHGRRIPLLVDTPHGAGYRTRFGRMADSPASPTESMLEGMTHVDKVLSVLGELAVSLDYRVVTNTNTEYPLAAILEDSLQRFHAERELEFTLIAYCDYLNQRSWKNLRGETHTIDDAIGILLDRGPSRGPCLGTHRVYAIAKFCMRRRRTPEFAGEETRRRAEEYLREISRCLVASQYSDGSWAAGWYRPMAPAEPVTSENDVTRYKNKIRVTGHMLEWMAIVPPDLRPPDENLVRAAKYLEGRLRSDLAFLVQLGIAARHPRGPARCCT